MERVISKGSIRFTRMLVLIFLVMTFGLSLTDVAFARQAGCGKQPFKSVIKGTWIKVDTVVLNGGTWPVAGGVKIVLMAKCATQKGPKWLPGPKKTSYSKATLLTLEYDKTATPPNTETDHGPHIYGPQTLTSLHPLQPGGGHVKAIGQG